MPKLRTMWGHMSKYITLVLLIGISTVVPSGGSDDGFEVAVGF